jgi:hypothetical protein
VGGLTLIRPPARPLASRLREPLGHGLRAFPAHAGVESGATALGVD